MQHWKSEITKEALPTHMHEELLLQGRLLNSRYGSSIVLQGPHDILSVECLVATPEGLHNIWMNQEGQKFVGTFRRWHKQLNPPTPQQQHLIYQWDL